MQNAMKRHESVTPVTPEKKGCHSQNTLCHAACDTVTPVTPCMHWRTRAHARAGIRVSHMSQVEHSKGIMGL